MARTLSLVALLAFVPYLASATNSAHTVKSEDGNAVYTCPTYETIETAYFGYCELSDRLPHVSTQSTNLGRAFVMPILRSRPTVISVWNLDLTHTIGPNKTPIKGLPLVGVESNATYPGAPQSWKVPKDSYSLTCFYAGSDAVSLVLPISSPHLIELGATIELIADQVT